MSVDFFGIEPESVRKLTRAEYDRMVDIGLFDRENVELVRGLLVRMSPQGYEHREFTRRLRDALMRALGDRVFVYDHSPYPATDDSKPEPDVFVVPAGDYRKREVPTAHLVVEIANTSLRYDRKIKAPLYAESGIPEFWLIDVNALTVEVYDRPETGRWTRTRLFRPGDVLELVVFPGVKLPVDSFLG